MNTLSESKLVVLEHKATMVQSIFPGTYYAIDKNGKGMWILSNGVEIPLLAGQVEEFAKEIIEVWKTLKG